MTSQTEMRRREELNAAPKCVLFLEDNYDDFYIASYRLEKIHFRTRLMRVCTADELMEYLRAMEAYLDQERFPMPMVVLIDQRLPQSSGLEAQTMMRAAVNCRRIPIIAISSSDNIARLKAAVELGADASMVKPFDAQEFVRIAARLQLPIEFGAATPA